MMSKTHISVGLTAALAAAPATSEGLYYALMGGALGSVICDIDRNAENPSRDNRQGWGIAGTIFFGAFLHETIILLSDIDVVNSVQIQQTHG